LTVKSAFTGLFSKARLAMVTIGSAISSNGSRYVSGSSRDWLKFKNPNAPAVRREADEDWGKERWR
jgi:hypothetical protein